MKFLSRTVLYPKPAVYNQPGKMLRLSGSYIADAKCRRQRIKPDNCKDRINISKEPTHP